MARSAVVFACSQCGHESAKWLGRCPSCAAWDTLVEEVRARTSAGGRREPEPRARVGARPLGSTAGRPTTRHPTGLAELDRVLGGGVVDGSAVLLGGDPGIGKSTLLLQAVAGLAPLREPALYISAEESEEQVEMRAERLGLGPASGLHLLSETSLETVLAECERLRARVVVADSVQTLWSDGLTSGAGSVAQVREVASRLVSFAKTSGAVVFLVGHVTKDGSIAGPRTLEHMVDTVLYFEGQRDRSHRIVRATKNRFGPAGELGVFEMGPDGLSGIENASAELLAERAIDVPGSVVLASVEGTRSLLVEVQALAADATAGMARRTANGFDPRRLALLLAVLERRAGVFVASRDLFLNVVGGIELSEPAADLAVLVAAASAAREAPVDPDAVLFGEVGLAGEVRAVGRVDLRLAEARRLGFRRAVVPEANRVSVAGEGLEVIGVRRVAEALDLVLRYPSGSGG